jgi:hypothetical protein
VRKIPHASTSTWLPGSWLSGSDAGLRRSFWIGGSGDRFG